MSTATRPVAADALRILAQVAPVALLALAWGCRESPLATSKHPPGRRVLLVGVDAGDWLAVEPLMAEGKLPTFARLAAAGRTGTMIATPPLVSPLIWTTIATGREPEDHGVLDFMVDEPGGGQSPVSGASRRAAALWNVFSDRGYRVAVVGWWATSPAEALDGVMVSDAVAPQLLRPSGLDADAIAPATEGARLAAFVTRPESVGFEELARHVPLTSGDYRAAQVSLASGGRAYRDPIAHLAAVVAATRTYGGMAETLLRSSMPAFAAVYTEAVDTVSHRFVVDPRRGPPAIAAAYGDVDALLARLAAAVPPDTWVVVCSDHGFQPPDAGIREDPGDLAGPATAWHRPYGIAAAAEARELASGATAASTAARVTLTPLDIAPTILHAAGLPVSEEMPGRVVPELLPPEARARPPARVARFEPPKRSAARARDADEGVRERLMALGYVSGTTTTSLARLNLGESLYRRGRLEAAEGELRAVVEAQPDNLAARLWLARTLQGRGRAGDAFRAYAEALRLAGGVEAAAVALADTAAAASAADEAAALLPHPGASAPEAAAIRTARAVLAQSRGRADEAERELRLALASDPASFDALSRLLDLAIAARRASTVVPLAREAVARAPRSPRLNALLGVALLATRRPAEAEQALSSALSLAPDGTAVRLDLARARIEQGEAQGALAAVDPAPASRDRSVLRGAALSQLQRWPEAAESYREALAQGPEDATLLNGLAYAELKSGRRDEARRLLERSLALDASQPPIARLLDDVRSGREIR